MIKKGQLLWPLHYNHSIGQETHSQTGLNLSKVLKKLMQEKRCRSVKYSNLFINNAPWYLSWAVWEEEKIAYLSLSAQCTV